jgi:SAM-dependent methyltransferase
MPDRTHARQLAAESLARGDATGWFERLYSEAARGEAIVPWADLQPNPNLLSWWKINAFDAYGQRALKIGCGFGDDAEQLSAWGFETTAFDIAESAIQECRRRFPQTRVIYAAADLLNPPRDWIAGFDFVLESYTLQVLPPELRPAAMRSVASFVKPGGVLLVIARGRETTDSPGQMPWPLTRDEVQRIGGSGLNVVSFEDFLDHEIPPVRRFRLLCKRDSAPAPFLKLRGGHS